LTNASQTSTFIDAATPNSDYGALNPIKRADEFNNDWNEYPNTCAVTEAGKEEHWTADVVRRGDQEHQWYIMSISLL